MQMKSLSTDIRNEIVVIQGMFNYLGKCCQGIFFSGVSSFLSFWPFFLPYSPPWLAVTAAQWRLSAA